MKTHEVLGITKHQYEMRLMSLYLQWINIHARNCDKTVQKLMISKSINKWFLKEYSKHLKEFKQSLNPYLKQTNITKSDKQLLWYKTVTKIFKTYPKPLIDQVIR